MRKLFGLLCFAWLFSSQAQPSSDFALQPWAVVNTSTNKITLNWKMVTGTDVVRILKKSPEEHEWTLVTSLPANTLSYTIDAPAQPTEYRIMRNYYTGTSLTNYGNGYIIPAIGRAEVTFNGKLLMIITKTLNDSLKTEIGETMRFLSGDGWQVDSIIVSETDKVVSIKSRIKDWYNRDPQNSKGLYLFGHVPVPYSGLLTGSSNGPMDGHTPDHDGAWVADPFYADMDGTYTDNYAQSTGSRAENKNIAGDGKYDQNTLQTYSELQVCRVDLSNLPVFGKTEVALARQYLAKIKNYKLNNWKLPRRALIDDRLGVFGQEAPGRGSWMSLSAEVGPDSIRKDTYFKVLKKNKYLIAHEISTGGYSTYIGVGTVSDYKDSVFSVFNSSFGSYFGDWDISNNIIRGTLASPGYTLSNCWNGRPLFLYHPMGMGYNLGYCAWRSQNNFGDGVQEPYPVFFGQGRLHISVQGDPSLRLHMMNPVSNVNATPSVDKKKATITWTASTEPGVIAYNIYRAHSWNGKFELIGSRVTGTTYTDNTPLGGLDIYMVRAVKLETTPSGTYYNQSIGMTAEVDNMIGLGVKSAAVASIKTYPNPANNYVIVSFPFSKGQFTVTDLSGKLVLSKEFDGSGNVQISTTNLNSGIYFISAKNAVGLQSSTKFAVSH